MYVFLWRTLKGLLGVLPFQITTSCTYKLRQLIQNEQRYRLGRWPVPAIVPGAVPVSPFSVHQVSNPFLTYVLQYRLPPAGKARERVELRGPADAGGGGGAWPRSG